MAIKSPKGKGRSGEREWCRLLNESLGTTYTRTPASGGGFDVKGDLQPIPGSKKSILDEFFHEVKRCQKLSIRATLKKANEQALMDQFSKKMAYVAWRCNSDKDDSGEWSVTLNGKDFIKLLRWIKEFRLQVRDCRRHHERQEN